MRFAIASVCLFFSLTAAASKPKAPEPVYQDAVLKSFHMTESGMSCSSNTNATSPDSSNTSTSCSPTAHASYTVVVGEQVIVIRPATSKKGMAGAAFSLGYSTLFTKASCLYGQLPGAHFLIRSDDNGTYHVRVGKRESLYKLEAAE